MPFLSETSFLEKQYTLNWHINCKLLFSPLIYSWEQSGTQQHAKPWFLLRYNQSFRKVSVILHLYPGLHSNMDKLMCSHVSSQESPWDCLEGHNYPSLVIESFLPVLSNETTSSKRHNFFHLSNHFIHRTCLGSNKYSISKRGGMKCG